MLSGKLSGALPPYMEHLSLSSDVESLLFLCLIPPSGMHPMLYRGLLCKVSFWVDPAVLVLRLGYPERNDNSDARVIAG